MSFLCHLLSSGSSDHSNWFLLLVCFCFLSFLAFHDHISLAGNHGDRLKHVTALDPKTEMSGHPRSSGGFVKSNKKFLVSDDLRITPLKSDLTVWELIDLKIGSDDVNIEEISIGRAEAINLLIASFATSSALTNGLSDLLAKKLKG